MLSFYIKSLAAQSPNENLTYIFTIHLIWECKVLKVFLKRKCSFKKQTFTRIWQSNPALHVFGISSLKSKNNYWKENHSIYYYWTADRLMHQCRLEQRTITLWKKKDKLKQDLHLIFWKNLKFLRWLEEHCFIWTIVES